MSSGASPGDDFPIFDLRRLMGGGGGDPWANAAELAAAIASGGAPGESEPNLDPLVRMQVEDLVRVAELHVAQATAITLPSNTIVRPVNRSEWTRRSVDAYRPFFERFGEALGSAAHEQGEQLAAESDPISNLLGQVFSQLGPILVSATTGTMLGHLGQRALGQYELPVPRSTDEVLVVPTTIDATADEWGVPHDDLRLWVLVHELTAHAVLSVPHVSRRMESLLIDFAAAFSVNPERITEHFESFEGPDLFSEPGGMPDLSKLQEMSESFDNPDMVLAMMRSPAHDLLVPQLDALVAAIVGFVSHTVETICKPLTPRHDLIKERFRGRWTEGSPADHFTEQLVGLSIDARTFERGDRFIAGIIERAGDEGLVRLWADELDLPTAAEIDAAGLWLARIGFDTEDGADSFTEVPDDLSGLDDV